MVTSTAETDGPSIALIGEPNGGKTTIFDLLTGFSQHADTWPGASLARRKGAVRLDGQSAHLIELPSVYSLTSATVEERLARDFIIHEQPDAVIVVVNAALMERGLYLVAELLALPAPVVLALNMMDVAARLAIEVDVDKLSAALGLPVVPMVAARNQGAADLLAAVARIVEHPAAYAPQRPDIRPDHRSVLSGIRQIIEPWVQPPVPVDWAAVKVLEGDEDVTADLQLRMAGQWQAVNDLLRQHDDAGLALASGRYSWIRRVMETSVRQPAAGPISLTDRIDRVATHPIAGLLLLLAIMGVIFGLIVGVGVPLQEWLDEHVVTAAADALREQMAGAPAWLVGLLADGVIGGAGTVLTLLPILVIFFAALAVLDDCGYLARAAYVMDGAMHLMGLHGHCFLPLFLGFGCNVPAILGAHVIDSPKARILTILITPLVPCGARMAVLAVLTPVFFGQQAFAVFWLLVALSLAAMILLGILLHELVLGGEHVAFIMDLPLYHRPQLRAVALAAWRQVADFIQGAGTVIVVVSVVIWAFSFMPNGNIESSYLASAGRLLSPIGALMGLGWQMMVALVTSFVRKENTLATLGVLFGSGPDSAGWTTALRAALTPAAGLSFLVVQLLFVPCVATVAAIRQETGSWRWTVVSVALLLTLSFAAGVIVYQGARLLGMAV